MLDLRCVKAVNRLSVGYGKPTDLSAISTEEVKYLTSQVFLYTGFWTTYKQLSRLSAQPNAGFCYLLGLVYSTLSPRSINTTNLNKGFEIS